MSENLNILIVDDDRRMAKTLVDIIKIKGFETESAHSGSEAMDKVKEGHFDCVITDIKMPEMNGVDLYKMIKQAQPDIPVVLMTAYSTDKLVKEGLEEGAIAALSKPLDIEALLNFFSMLRKERSIVIVDDDPMFCKTLGDIYLHLIPTEVERIEQTYRQALDAYRDAEDERGQGGTYVALGNVAAQRGQVSQAIAMWTMATSVFEKLGIVKETARTKEAMQRIWARSSRQ